MTRIFVLKNHKDAGLLILSLGVSKPSNCKKYPAVPACPEAPEAPEITEYPEDSSDNL